MSTNPFSLSSLDGSNGFRLDGVAAGELSGVSVSAAGDVNGDGIDDLIIGAPFARPPDSVIDPPGASYVVFGRDTDGDDPAFNATFALSALDGTNGFRLDGGAGFSEAGRSVSAVGDVNGDGIDDLIIGAPSASPNEAYSGSSYVVFGRDTDGEDPAFGATLALSALDGTNGFRLDGVGRFDQSGRPVSAAGDVNGDGIDDLIIGAPFADNASGSSFVIFGRDTDGDDPAFDSTLALSSLDGSNGFRLDGVAANEESGFSVSAAGDVNGDGIDDLIIGATRADITGRDAGASYVVFGRDTDGDDPAFGATIALADLDASDGFRLDGVDGFDQTGRSVSAAGDVNGDGIDDLIIGAWSASPNGTFSGSSYVVFGSAPDTEAPVVMADQSFVFQENQPAGVPLGLVVATDNEGVKDFAISGGNDDGYFVINAEGEISLTDAGASAAANDFETGANSFPLQITAEDAEGNISAATDVTLSLVDINETPVARDDGGAGFTTIESTPFTTADVLANDEDPENDDLKIVAIGLENTRGEVTDNGDGTFSYDPGSFFDTLHIGETDTDVFTYTVADDFGTGTTATVTLTIEGQTLGLVPTGPGGDDDDDLTGTPEDDVITPGLGQDVVTLLGGADTILGALSDLFGDTIQDFSESDRFVFADSDLDRSRFSSTILSDPDSLRLGIDEDGDGASDGFVTLEGMFSGGDIMTFRFEDTTILTFESFLADLEMGVALDEELVNGVVNQFYLTGDGTTDFVLSMRDLGFAGYDNVIGVYEVTEEGDLTDVRILIENANADKEAQVVIDGVENGNTLGFFIVQDAAERFVGATGADDFRFINSVGATANVFDGNDLRLVRGGERFFSETIFHSFSAEFNPDGLEHAVSGVDEGGETMTIGFEDLTGGGDRDYEDVAFSIARIDTFEFDFS